MRTGDKRDLHAHAAHHLGQLRADVARADEDQAFRQYFEFQKTGAVERADFLDAVDGRQNGTPARGDDGPRCFQGSLTDCHATFDQPRGTGVDVIDILIFRQKVRVFLLAQGRNQIVLGLNERLPIIHLCPSRQAGEPLGSPRTVHGLCRTDHRLGGHASHVDASSADGAMSYEGDTLSGIRAGNCGGEPRRSGPKNDQVIAALFIVVFVQVFHLSAPRHVRGLLVWRRADI